MDRRRFLLTSLAGALAAPLAAAAQQAGGNRAWKVGWLALVPLPGLRAEFKEGMRELGHVEGSTYVLHERYADGKGEMLGPLAAELVRRRMDVILAEAVGPARAAQLATKTIPIVFKAVTRLATASFEASPTQAAILPALRIFLCPSIENALKC